MTARQYQHTYPLDNEEEVSRLNNQHDVVKDAMGGLVLAPLDLLGSPLRILDSGTADGTWIQDLAATYASVPHEFYGTDIKPSDFPADPPPRTTYQAQDIKEPWPADWTGRFDLVHQRLVLPAAGGGAEEALRSLGAMVRPGGWIQLIEGTFESSVDGNGPIMHDFVKVMNVVMANNYGDDFQVADRLPEWLQNAGFVEIQDRYVYMKLGAQNPDATLARKGAISTSTSAGGMSQFAKCLSPEQIPIPVERLDSLRPDLMAELMETGGLFPLRVVWGRKPLR